MIILNIDDVHIANINDIDYIDDAYIDDQINHTGDNISDSKY